MHQIRRKKRRDVYIYEIEPFLSAMTEWTTSGNNFEMKFDEQEKSNFVRLSK